MSVPSATFFFIWYLLFARTEGVGSAVRALPLPLAFFLGASSFVPAGQKRPEFSMARWDAGLGEVRCGWPQRKVPIMLRKFVLVAKEKFPLHQPMCAWIYCITSLTLHPRYLPSSCGFGVFSTAVDDTESRSCPSAKREENEEGQADLQNCSFLLVALGCHPPRFHQVAIWRRRGILSPQCHCCCL